MLRELMNKEVEVKTADIIYRGILADVGETELALSSDSGWITVPMDNILYVKAVE